MSTLPFLCFQSLDKYFEHGEIETTIDHYEVIDKHCGVFVTYMLRDGQLRGCIGSVSPVILSENLAKYAVKAAVDDHRFEPLKAPLPIDLTCSVSLLQNHKNVDSFDDILIGKHGVMAKYMLNGYQVGSSTFLPHVILDQNWEIDDLRHHLVKKSGIRHYDKVQLTVYESTKTPHVTYTEYKSSI